jgi:uncharacterized Zn finger protein
MQSATDHTDTACPFCAAEAEITQITTEGMGDGVSVFWCGRCGTAWREIVNRKVGRNRMPVGRVVRATSDTRRSSHES